MSRLFTFCFLTVFVSIYAEGKQEIVRKEYFPAERPDKSEAVIMTSPDDDEEEVIDEDGSDEDESSN